jgi:hypothetical protein
MEFGKSMFGLDAIPLPRSGVNILGGRNADFDVQRQAYQVSPPDGGGQAPSICRNSTN